MEERRKRKEGVKFEACRKPYKRHKNNQKDIL
jgi:hypothetical protein